MLTAIAEGPAPPPVERSPRAVSGPRRVRLDDDGMRRWVAERVEAARRGAPERVRIPVVRRVEGWGCLCPTHYIGTNPAQAEGPWLTVTLAKGLADLGPGDAAMAEGSFGSPVETVTLDEDEGASPYELVPFTATRLTPLPAGTDGDDVALELL